MLTVKFKEQQTCCLHQPQSYPYNKVGMEKDKRKHVQLINTHTHTINKKTVNFICIAYCIDACVNMLLLYQVIHHHVQTIVKSCILLNKDAEPF